MMDNGKTIICMDMEDYTIQIKNWHIKDSGIWISFTAKEECIMINLHHVKENSITQILKIYNNNGITMKEP